MTDKMGTIRRLLPAILGEIDTAECTASVNDMNDVADLLRSTRALVQQAIDAINAEEWTPAVGDKVRIGESEWIGEVVMVKPNDIKCRVKFEDDEEFWYTASDLTCLSNTEVKP